MKWEKYKAKRLANPEWAKQEKEKIMKAQYIRYHNNPEIRRRHAIACATWRMRKAQGLTGRKPHSPPVPADLPEFKEADFNMAFD